MGENIDKKVSQESVSRETPSSRIPEFMGFGEFARYRGVSLAAVQSQIKAGIIVPVLNANGKKKINVAKANADWIDLKKIDKPIGGKSKIAPFAESRALREQYAAKSAKLEYEEKLGTMIMAEKVKVQLIEVAQVVRNNILDLPPRLAAGLAAETDAAKIELFLTKELSACLETLANYASKR